MELFNRFKLAYKAFKGSAPDPRLAVKAAYSAAEYSPNRRQVHAPVTSARVDISTTPRMRIVGLSRYLEQNDALVNRFLDLMEQYVVGPHGLRIRPASLEQQWNANAQREIDEWSPYADLCSRQSFDQLQSLICRLWAVDGEVFIYLTQSPDTGRPRIQLLETQQVATPPHLRGDRDIVDGVELTEYGRPEAYWIWTGGDQNPLNKEGWSRVPADRIVHVFEPSRAGQVRGLPLFHAVINDLLDLQELQGLEMLAAKDAAVTSKVIKTKTPDMTEDDMGVGASLRKVQPSEEDTIDKSTYYREVLGAETAVLQDGDEMEQFQSNRPSVAVQQFWDHVIARSMAGAGLPVEVVLLSRTGGTQTRAALDMANAWFRSRSAALSQHLGRVYEYVIGSAIDEGLLKSPPFDWRKYRYTPPRAINVDAGRNSAALINEWRSGFRSLDMICSEMGLEWKDVVNQRIEEITYIKELAAQKGHKRAEVMLLDPNELSAGVED